jgi:hypothetical protein
VARRMISTNARFDAKHAALGRMPIYVFAIGGQATVYTTHDLVQQGITGTLPAYGAWLKTPQGASQSVDVLNGSASIGEMSLEVIEHAGAIRTLVGANVLEGSSATLSVGYSGMAYADFVTLNTYRIYKVLPSSSYTSWTFTARDLQLTAKRTISDHPENGEPLSESNPWFLQGTPAEICQAIYLWCLGLDPSQLDRTALLALDSEQQGLYKTVRPFQFRLTEAFEAKQFLESEVYKVAAMHPLVDNLGRISLRAFRAPAAGAAAAFAFDDSNMIVLPDIDRMDITNEVIFQFDDEGGSFTNELVFIEETSVSLYGAANQQNIESKGLRTEFGAWWFCEEVARRLFRRFAGAPGGLRGGAPIYSIQAFLMTLPVWVGDYVAITHPLMPDIMTGAAGVVNRLMEVVDRTPDYAGGTMSYKLLDTGVTGQAAAHKFATSARNFLIGTSEVY